MKIKPFWRHEETRPLRLAQKDTNESICRDIAKPRLHNRLIIKVSLVGSVAELQQGYAGIRTKSIAAM